MNSLVVQKIELRFNISLHVIWEYSRVLNYYSWGNAESYHALGNFDALKIVPDKLLMKVSKGNKYWKWRDKNTVHQQTTVGQIDNNWVKII